MKCSNCPHYKSGYMYNGCGVTESEYFREPNDCTLVKDDGSINYNNPYFDPDTEMEAGE